MIRKYDTQPETQMKAKTQRRKESTDAGFQLENICQISSI